MKPEATSDAYGVSLQSPAWVLKQFTKLGGLRVVHFAETTWHRHQDCFGCVRDDSVRYTADSSTIPRGKYLSHLLRDRLGITQGIVSRFRKGSDTAR